MKHMNILSATAIALMSVAGLAQAGSVADDFKVTVNVPVNCNLLPFGGTTLYVPSAAITASTSVNLIAHCSYLTPFQVQLYTTAPGGKLDVTDASISRTYQVKFTKPSDGTPYGRIADGEARSEIGTGEQQAVDANVSFNADGAYGRPQIGSYAGTLVAEAVY
jgi:hypothetical protein